MANPQIALTELRSRKSGINFVCSGCGALLYHIGIDGVEDSGGNKSDRSAYSLQPPISDVQENCARCGRKLNFDINPDRIRIRAIVDSESERHA